jgi:sulfoxide reductase heme-binding subunit YedZ
VNGVTWYTARAAGVLAYVLLTSGSVLGVVLARRVPLPWPRFAVEDVHRFVTILTGVFLALHVGAILVDDYVPFSLGEVFIPFSSDYRPFATALGVVALELLIAVALTNLVRRRIPYRVWRRAHYLGFGVWLAATVHGILVGTDRAELWFVLVYIGAVTAVAAAAVARLTPPESTGPGHGRGFDAGPVLGRRPGA